MYFVFLQFIAFSGELFSTIYSITVGVEDTLQIEHCIWNHWPECLFSEKPIKNWKRICSSKAKIMTLAYS